MYRVSFLRRLNLCLHALLHPGVLLNVWNVVIYYLLQRTIHDGVQTFFQIIIFVCAFLALYSYRSSYILKFTLAERTGLSRKQLRQLRRCCSPSAYSALKRSGTREQCEHAVIQAAASYAEGLKNFHFDKEPPLRKTKESRPKPQSTHRPSDPPGNARDRRSRLVTPA